MEKQKFLINDCIVLQMEHIRKECETANFADQKLILCQCTEILSKAYQNINNQNNNMEETNNESN